MKPSTYFVALTERILGVIKILIEEKIKNKRLWRDMNGWIGPTHCDYSIFTQDRELKKLSGVIKKKSRMVTWEAPKNSRVYELVGIRCARSTVYYYLLCLGDGREFFLKQKSKSIQLIKCLPVSVYRQLLLKILKEVRWGFNEREINKIIKKII